MPPGKLFFKNKGERQLEYQYGTNDELRSYKLLKSPPLDVYSDLIVFRKYFSLSHDEPRDFYS